MLFSKSFIPTLREAKEESLSFNLSLRAGLISPLASGIYSYLPLGLKVLKNIERIIRKHMNGLGANEVLLPSLQPLDLWQKTGRDKTLGEVMIKFQDRRKRNLCLGPTHEEVITDLVARFVSSYKQLPLVLYQIQTKFRDELRPRSGLIRGCEFSMKDAYSFDKDEAGVRENYNKMLKAYEDIFKECGLKTIVLEAESGFIGGSVSHEFLSQGLSGEDMVKHCLGCGAHFKGKEICPKCSSKEAKEIKALELGHVFNLGDIYSKKLGAYFLDEKGKRLPLLMGCYGIGVSRIISAVIEQNCDEEGIIWPLNISPFDLEVICLNPDDEDIRSFSSSVYQKLKSKKFEVLFDERVEYSGVKFKDANLLGIPFQIIIGKKRFKENKVEVFLRGNKQAVLLDKSNIFDWVDKEVKRD